MKIVKKILKSFLNFFLFSALIHNVVLIISTIRNGDIKYLNYFRIIGLEEFWPRISTTNLSDLVSMMIMMVIVLGFLVFSLRNKIKI